MTTRGGYGRDEAVNTLKSAKGPVELGIILNNFKKSAKLTEQEFTALSESVNDFSFVSKSIGDNGQYVVEAMQQIAQKGLLLTDAQQEAVKWLGQLGQTSRDSLQRYGRSVCSQLCGWSQENGHECGKSRGRICTIKACY